jgi:hypothetical protein
MPDAAGIDTSPDIAQKPVSCPRSEEAVLSSWDGSSNTNTDCGTGPARVTKSIDHWHYLRFAASGSSSLGSNSSRTVNRLRLNFLSNASPLETRFQIQRGLLDREPAQRGERHGGDSCNYREHQRIQEG